jgi:hypothetical protein
LGLVLADAVAWAAMELGVEAARWMIGKAVGVQ